MPNFVLHTNVPRASIPPSFLKELSALVAKTTGKPEAYVTVTVIPDEMMLFGGTDEPCAQAKFGCIGKIGKEENRKHAEVLYAKINKDLGIPMDRMYIEFADQSSANIGFNGKTFATL